MAKFRTYGLTHIALQVSNIKRTLKFYKEIFDVQVMYEDDNMVQVQTPGTNDIIVFEEGKENGKDTGGIEHFGFRMVNAGDMPLVVSTVKKAGGKIKDTGEFIPGEPYVFFYDPDGYEIEIWFEKA